jgi:hypothetical protein
MTQTEWIDRRPEEFRRHRARAGWLELERARCRNLVHLTDVFVDELEQLNLDEVESVSADWRPRLASLFAELPFPYVPWLRADPSPTEVLDLLFDLQGRLLDLKRAQSALSVSVVPPFRLLAHGCRRR